MCLGALPYVIDTWLDSKGDAQKGLELLLNIEKPIFFFTKIQAVWSQTEVNTSMFIHMLFSCYRIKVVQINSANVTTDT